MVHGSFGVVLNDWTNHLRGHHFLEEATWHKTITDNKQGSTDSQSVRPVGRSQCTRAVLKLLLWKRPQDPAGQAKVEQVILPP